jgi:hypothetical protein
VNIGGRFGRCGGDLRWERQAIESRSIGSSSVSAPSLNYRKSLELDPDNKNATEMLAKLGSR